MNGHTFPIIGMCGSIRFRVFRGEKTCNISLANTGVPVCVYNLSKIYGNWDRKHYCPAFKFDFVAEEIFEFDSCLVIVD